MTLLNADGIALIPKRCSECFRLFWLEPYYTTYKEVGIEHRDIKQVWCKKCKPEWRL